jgi:predicted TIM-barrel fold metal-dependent hydrolase
MNYFIITGVVNMIVDEHVHLGGLFQDTDYFIKCLDESNIDFVLATPYMFEDKNIPRTLKAKRIPPWLAGTRLAMELVARIMRSKKFRKRYIDYPPNDYVAEMAKKYPERIYGVYWVNPNLEEISKIERYLTHENFVAIKFHQVLYPCELNDKSFKFFDLANEYKVPVFIHVDSLQEVRTIMKYMEKKSDLNVIMAHLNYFEEVAEEISDFPNMYFDISPLYAHKDDKLINAVNKVGADRLLFGSDAPCPGFQKYAVNRIRRLNIPEEDKNKILGDNIIRLISKRTTIRN